jgi:hypothetical protein
MAANPKRKPPSKILGRDEILGAPDLKRERVEVPEWGGAVFIREMTADERDRWEASTLDENGRELPPAERLGKFRSTLGSMCICDANGVRIMSDDDVDELGRKSTVALGRCFEVIKRLNAIFEDDIEQLVKN